jgi:hypothetical protein
MKRLLLVLVLLLSVLPSVHADELLTVRPKPFRSALKVSGKALTILGILFSTAGAGLGLALTAGPKPLGESQRTAEGIFLVLSGGLFGLGVVHAAIGVPLWVAGTTREKQVNGYLRGNGLAVTF